MSPVWVGPSSVAPARVRRLSAAVEVEPAVLRVAVLVVPAADVVPRPVEPQDRRLEDLQAENALLRAELAQLRSAG